MVGFRDWELIEIKRNMIGFVLRIVWGFEVVYFYFYNWMFSSFKKNVE